MERVAESGIVLNLRVFVFIVGGEIEEKLEKYSQRGYCSSTINYFKKVVATKMDLKKTPAGGGARGRNLNIPE